MRLIRQTQCKLCHNIRSTAYFEAHPEVKALTRYRSFDKKYGLQNDLTVEFVREAFLKPCEYCGGKDPVMTLDRKDSSTGHLMTNVTTCCLPCNVVKRDMPYDMWLLLVPGMRKARELGYFLQWVTSFGRLGNYATA